MTFITPGPLSQRLSEVSVNRKNKLSSVQLVGIKARIMERIISVSIQCDEVAIEISYCH